MNPIYNLDIKKLATLLTPTFLRGRRHLAWLRCLLFPLQKVQDRLIAHRKESIYKLEHTAQVASLEKVLNDAFDIDARRIIVQNVERKEALYIYKESENTPTFIYAEAENKTPKYLYAEGITENSLYHFLVFLPLDIWQRESTEIAIGEYRFYAIEAVIDFYKLPSKKYKIVIK